MGRDVLDGFKAPPGLLTFREWLAGLPSDHLLMVKLSRTQTVSAVQLRMFARLVVVLSEPRGVLVASCTLVVLQEMEMTKEDFLKAHDNPNDPRHPMAIDLEFSRILAMMTKFSPPRILTGD
jgi:hypothetical protein